MIHGTAKNRKSFNWFSENLNNQPFKQTIKMRDFLFEMMESPPISDSFSDQNKTKQKKSEKFHFDIFQDQTFVYQHRHLDLLASQILAYSIAIEFLSTKSNRKM